MRLNYNNPKIKTNALIDKFKSLSLIVVILIASFLYLTHNVNPEFFQYSMSLRLPKLIAMILVSICIALATYIFQVLADNEIVSPSLLGMNSLYILIHTLIAFIFGVSSPLFLNTYLSYILVLFLMTVASLIIYGYLFRKTDYNVLYILLAGTVLSTMFSSMQSSIIRIMEPNEYDQLLLRLVASFSRVNTNLLGISALLLILILYIFYKDFKYLNILSLGRDQAINLGVDFEKTTRRLLILVSLLISISTALVGPITFLGLLIVNIARNFIYSYKYKYVIFISALIGMTFLITSQLIIEHVFIYAIPVSVIINIFGGMYFIYLLSRQKGRI